MSNIDKRALRKAAIHAKTVDDWGCDADNFHEKATPDAVLALLDELEAKDRRIAELENQLKAAENNEIDARCRIAELEESHAQVIHSRDHYKRMCGEKLRLVNQSINLSINGED